MRRQTSARVNGTAAESGGTAGAGLDKVRGVRRRTPPRWSLGLALLAAAAWVAAATPARAGDQRPCTDPAVFQGAAVTSFVLPYRYTGKLPPPSGLEDASRQIAGLVHFHVLFSMLKYGAVGGVDLVAVPGQVCDVSHVIAQVTSGSATRSLRPGQTLVVTWGRVFQQGDQLYVQSYVRFLRQTSSGPTRETISVALGAPDDPLTLIAALPAQSIAFPPRRITKAELRRVATEFKRSMVVRPRKDLDAPGQSIDFDPWRTFPYGVTRAEDDWMWIQPLAGGPAGWVRARVDDPSDQWSLQSFLPELAFVDAVCGFMRLHAMGGVEASTTRSRIRAAVESGLTRYEKAVPADLAPEAYGLAQAMRGFLLFESDATVAGRAKAAELFADARSRMPDYAAALNLAAATQPLRAVRALDRTGVERLERELVGALALEPSDRLVLRNLDRLYQAYATRPEWSWLGAAEIAQKRAVVEAASAKATKDPY